jgi:Secretion system C-terminal sorting domain
MLLMKKFMFYYLLLIINLVTGQNTFFKIIGGSINDESRFVEQTNDGGYFIVGNGYSSPTSISGYAIKTNSLGDTIWTREYANNAYFNSSKQTTDGGYILVGNIYSSGMASDVYVLKIDSNGIVQWEKNIGGANNDIGTCVKQTLDGGYVITGYGQSLSAGSDDVFVIKLDATGNLQWNYILGQISPDKGYSIEITNDGGYIIAGITGANACLLKLDSLGTLQWAKKYSETGIPYKGRGVIQTTDNGYLVLCSRKDSIYNYVSVLKTDSVGIVNWGKEYLGSEADDYTSFKMTSAGNCIIASTINNRSSILLSLIDANGNLIWSRYMGESSLLNRGSFAAQTIDGGYIFTGYTKTFAVGGYIYLIKTDSLGRNGCLDSAASIIVNNTSPLTNVLAITSSTGLLINTPISTVYNSSRTVITICTSVEINELVDNAQITVYPNPSAGLFNFTGLENESTIEIFDIMGQLTFVSLTTGTYQTINLKNYSKGIYFYRIMKNMKVVAHGKLLSN